MQTNSQSVDWDKVALAGKTLELLDDRKFEQYRFSGDGVAAVTIGWKDGPLTAPLYYWKTEGKTLFISEDPGQASIERFDLLSVRGNQVDVQRKSGEKTSFKLE